MGLYIIFNFDYFIENNFNLGNNQKSQKSETKENSCVFKISFQVTTFSLFIHWVVLLIKGSFFQFEKLIKSMNLKNKPKQSHQVKL